MVSEVIWKTNVSMFDLDDALKGFENSRTAYLAEDCGLD